MEIGGFGGNGCFMRVGERDPGKLQGKGEEVKGLL